MLIILCIIDIFDKISINLLVQRLSQLLKIPIANFESIDFKSPDPFACIEIPPIYAKLWKWYPTSIEILLKEARNLDEAGKNKTDHFTKDRLERIKATQLMK